MNTSAIRRWLPALGKTLVVALLYALLATVSNYLAVPPSYASSFWLPSGLALIAALHAGRAGLVGVWLGAYAGNVWSVVTSFGVAAWLSQPWVPAVIALGAAIEAYLASSLLRHFRFWPVPPSGWRLVIASVLVSGAASVASALIGTFTLVLSRSIAIETAYMTIMTWWIGDVCGILLLLPLAYWPAQESRQHQRQFLREMLLPSVAIFSLAILAFISLLRVDRNQQIQNLAEETEHLEGELRAGANRSIALVNALAAFMESSSYVSRKEFETFARGLIDDGHPVQALQWSPLIDSSEALAAYQLLLQEEGLTHLRIKPIPGVTQWSEAPTMIPITYIYPMLGNEKALGLDVWSEPVRRANLQRAIISGRVQASPPLSIVQMDESVPAFLLDKAVRLQRTDGVQRGVARGVFTINQLAHAAIQQTDPRGFYWTLSDAEAAGKILLSRGEAPPAARWNLPVQKRQFEVAGHQWILHVEASTTYLQRHQSLNLWAAQLGSVLIASAWGLFLFGQWVQARHLQRTSEQLNHRNQELVQSQSLFETLSEASPVGIFRTGACGSIRYANPAYRQIIGRDAGQLNAAELDWIHPDDLSEFMSVRSQAREAGSAINHSFRIRTQSRGVRWAMSSAKPLRDVNGRFDGHIGSLVDVTALKRNEMALRCLNAAPVAHADIFLRYLAEGMSQVFTADIVIIAEYTRADFSRCRTRACRVDGQWAPDREHDLQGRWGSTLGSNECLIVTHDAQSLYPDDESLTRLGVEAFAAVSLRDASGRVTGYLGFMQRQPLQDTDIPALLDLFRLRIEAEYQSWDHERQMKDLLGQLESRVARRTTELRDAKEHAERANRAKSDFLAMMSHEIRTPMNSALGLLELVLLSPLSRDQRDLLDTAQDSARALLRLIDDLLDFSKIEAGKLDMAPESTTLRDLIQRVRDLYAEATSQKNLKLIVNLDPKLAPAHHVDPLRVRQILTNLMSNAVKFTDQGSIVLEVSVRDQQPGIQWVAFSVTDTGVGVASEQLAKLFQPFSQAHADGSRRFGGTGLGLSISRRLAELMGGTLTMTSEAGRGSVLTLNIPLPVVDPDTRTTLQSRRAKAYQPDASSDTVVDRSDLPTVLAVDDHAPTRLLLQMQLKRLGFQCVLAQDGEEALALWTQHRYRIVVTDCNMPKLDGYELARRIREIEDLETPSVRVRIIGCTASKAHHDVTEPVPTGRNDMDEYLIKPIDMERLAAVTGAAAEQVAYSLPEVDASLLRQRASQHLQQLTGDAESAESLMNEFLQSLQEDANTLAAALASDDAKAVHRAAHRLKGTAAALGDKALQDRFQHWQTLAQAGQLEELHQDHEALARAIHRYASPL